MIAAERGCRLAGLIVLLAGLAAWAVWLARAIPAAPYLNYDEAIHAGAGTIVYDAVFDGLRGTHFARRSWHFFNAGLIYWPFVHGLLLGLAYLVFGLRVEVAHGFSIALGALTLAALYRLGRRQFGAPAAVLAAGSLALARPYLVISRTVMLDGLQFLVLLLLYGHYFRTIVPPAGERPRVRCWRLSGLLTLLAFTRITGLALGLAPLALYGLLEGLRRRQWRFWRLLAGDGRGGRALALAAGLPLAALGFFYGAAYAGLDYDVIAAYREQQQEPFLAVFGRDLGRYGTIVDEALNERGWIVLAPLAASLAAFFARRPPARFLACVLVVDAVFFQLVRLKEIRFLLPWFGLLGLVTGAMVTEWLERWGRRGRAAAWAVALALLAGFWGLHVQPANWQRERDSSGMQAAVAESLRVMRPGAAILVRSYAANYWYVLLDRPPRVRPVNYFFTWEVRGLTPEYVLSEENSQMDYPDDFKNYLKSSGQWEPAGVFEGDEACILYRKAVPEQIVF